MEIPRSIFLASILLFLFACSTSTNLTKVQQNAENAWEAGDYQAALANYETIIADYQKQGKVTECPVYFQAAQAADRLGNSEKSLRYLEQNTFTPFVNAETYFELSQRYKAQDNLSKELDALENYDSKFPDGKQISAVHQRLFQLYLEIEDWEKVAAEWGKLSESKQREIPNLEGYFLANKAMKNDSVCDLVATGLLELDDQNLMALEWTAKKYFWQAENRYQAELEAYENNKTNKQYNQLLRALDMVSADFKKSLGYFKTLYDLDPDPKTAKYLGNIYNRLDDKEKAEFYYSKSE